MKYLIILVLVSGCADTLTDAQVKAVAENCSKVGMGVRVHMTPSGSIAYCTNEEQK